MRNKTLYIVLTLSMTLMTPGATAERAIEIHYVAGDGLVLWCDADPHPVLPQQPPGGSTGPAWLLSGEPECAAGDGANVVHEVRGEARSGHGFGGAVFEYLPQEQLSHMTVRTGDRIHGGDTYMVLYAEREDGDRESSQGCGPQTIILPPHMHGGWPIPEDLRAIVEIPPVGIEDDLTVCGATAGTVEAVITEPPGRL